jgi:uncharacterized RDD family membrane protein YckC
VEAAGPAPTPYASWGRRFAAYLADSAIVVLVAVIPIGLIVLVAENEDTVATAATIAAIAFVVVFPAAYHTVLVGRSGQTLGKRMLGIAVRDEDREEEPIGYGRAFGRWLLAYVLWSLCYVPGLVDSLRPLWDDRNQTWHDSATRSIVVRT